MLGLERSPLTWPHSCSRAFCLRVLADIYHPNLIKLYDRGHTGDASFITMEYLEGVDLFAHRRLGKRQPDAAQLDRICDAFGQLMRRRARAAR